MWKVWGKKVQMIINQMSTVKQYTHKSFTI